jgi:hypothetical protein
MLSLTVILLSYRLPIGMRTSSPYIIGFSVSGCWLRAGGVCSAPTATDRAPAGYGGEASAAGAGVVAFDRVNGYG